MNKQILIFMVSVMILSIFVDAYTSPDHRYDGSRVGTSLKDIVGSLNMSKIGDATTESCYTPPYSVNGSCIIFQGSQDAFSITSGYFAGRDDFSISFWTYRIGNGDQSQSDAYFGDRDGSTRDFVLVGDGFTDLNYYFQLKTDNTNFVTYDGTPLTFDNEINTWTLLTVVKNNSNIVLYENQTVVVSASLNGDGVIDDTSTSDFWFGCMGSKSGGEYCFNGKMYDIQIWDSYSLTRGEIDEIITGIQVIDNPPKWVSFTNDGANVTYGGIVNFTVGVRDDIGISSITLATNMSGMMVNYSTQYFSSVNETDANFSIQVTSNGGLVCAQAYFNDTAKQWNLTNLSCFYVNPLEVYNVFSIKSGNNASVINFTSNGYIFAEKVYTGELIEGSLPLFTEKEYAYRQINEWDLLTVERLHNTAPLECRREFGYNPLCVIKILAKSMQYLEDRLQFISDKEKEIDKKIARLESLNNHITTLYDKVESRSKDIEELKVNMIEVLDATNMTIPSFDRAIIVNETKYIEPIEVKR